MPVDGADKWQNVRMPAESRGLRLGVLGDRGWSRCSSPCSARLWYLQVMAQPPAARRRPPANQVRTVPLAPMRGRILDRDGPGPRRQQVARSIVTVDRRSIQDKADRTALFARLAGVLGDHARR